MRLVLSQRTRADGGPVAVEVAGETRRDEICRVGRLLHGTYAVAQNCSQFLDQMRSVARLLELLDGCDDHIIANAFGVDCMHCLSSW